MPSSHGPNTLVVDYDDLAVANAALLLPATLARRLVIEAVVNRLVDAATVPAITGQAAKVLTLVQAPMVGGDCIDADVLHTGPTAAVLGHRVMAASTLGTFLRSFSFGHIRQLDRVATRSWAGRGRPGVPRRCDRPVDAGADAGFWRPRSWPPAAATACASIAVRQTSVSMAIAAIIKAAWTNIDDPDGGIAQVAEATLLRHCPRGASWPTPPGWSSLRSRSTCSLGRHPRTRR